ncbi:MAG: hypothetical protein LQ352_008429, partial [Teloschistes flavicans]
MRARFGLTSHGPRDFEDIFSEALDLMEAHELDFHHFFRRLSSVRVAELASEEARKDIAARFFHAEGVTAGTDAAARERIARWLDRWRNRVLGDWSGEGAEEERMEAMRKVNPKFVPRSWVLDEVIRRVEQGGEREVVGQVMAMALRPFADE